MMYQDAKVLVTTKKDGVKAAKIVLEGKTFYQTKIIFGSSLQQ